MSTLLPQRIEGLLVELDELWQNEPRTKLTVTEVPGASSVKIMHPSMTREWATTATAFRAATLADIEDLEAAGVVAVDWGSSANGRRGDLRLTAAGEAHSQRVRTPPPAPPGPLGSGWHADVLPLLRASYELERDLATGAGLTQDALNAALGRPAGDQQTSTTLVQLSAGGYLRDEQSVDQIEGPISFRLGEKALQQIAGWPGAPAGDLAAQLLSLLDERIADPSLSDAERSRLERLRDTAGDVGKGVLSGLLAALIKSQTGM